MKPNIRNKVLCLGKVSPMPKRKTERGNRGFAVWSTRISFVDLLIRPYMTQQDHEFPPRAHASSCLCTGIQTARIICSGYGDHRSSTLSWTSSVLPLLLQFGQPCNMEVANCEFLLFQGLTSSPPIHHDKNLILLTFLYIPVLEFLKAFLLTFSEHTKLSVIL